MKHTPGPWQLEPNGAAFDLYTEGRPERFCILIGMTYSPDGEHEANAKFIASAPETAAELDQLRALNAELVDLLRAGIKAAAKLDDAHDVVTGIAAERAIHDWAVTPRISPALAKAKEAGS